MKFKILNACFFIIAFLFLLPEPIENKLDNKTAEKTNLHAPSGNFIIRNTRLYDGDELLNNVDLIVKNNRIYKIGKSLNLVDKLNDKDLPEIDGHNKTILPGLVDAHTHAYGSALTDAINFGVTTELDMFTMPEFANQHQLKRDDEKNNKESDLFSSTILATTKGGHGTEYGFKIPVLEYPKQVDSFVIDRIKQGADYIKAVYNAKEAKQQFFPSISYEILKALIISAHSHNKLLVVHVDNLLSARHAIELGADGIVHSFMDKVADEQFVELMVDKNAFIIPTLSVQAALTQNPDGERLLKQNLTNPFLSVTQKQQLRAKFPDFKIPPQAFKNALASVQKLSERGVAIIAGTDAPNPGTTHGVSLYGELFLLVKAGLTNEQAIHSATGAAGKYFPIDDRGTLKLKAPATLIMLDGNPFTNINDISKIIHIWKNGQLIKRKIETGISSNIKIKPQLISDFNAATNVMPTTIEVMKSSDQIAGGESTVSLELKNKSNNDQYLNISGELKQKFMFPWSGIAYLPTKSIQTGANFSQIKSLTFSAKSNLESSSGTSTETRVLSVLLFQQGSFQPLEQTIELTSEWQNYTVDLKDYGKTDLTNIVNLSLVINKKLGTFDFSIDDLKLQ